MHATKQNFMGSKASNRQQSTATYSACLYAWWCPPLALWGPSEAQFMCKCATVNTTSQTTDMTIIGHSKRVKQQGPARQAAQFSRTQTEHLV